MYELLLAALTCAASVAAAIAFARGQPREGSKPDPGDAARAGLVALVCFGAGAISSLPHLSAARGAWLGASALFGSLLGSVAPMIVPKATDHAMAACAVIAEEGVALFGMSCAVLAAAAISGALRDPQVLAPAAPALVVGVAVGAQVARSERVACVTVETILVMIPFAMLYERNALMLRAGPIATSAIGVFVLPIAIRALGLVALGGAAWARGKDARAIYVHASLMATAVLGAAFVMAGMFWPSVLFCGVAGVAASLVVWRAGRRAVTWTLAFAAVAGAIVASVVVVDRTGLLHATSLALGLVALSLSSSAQAYEVLEPEGDRGFTRSTATLALAPIALFAVNDASIGSACARWAASENLPTSDTAVLLARCESAKLSAQHVDLLHPSVILGAAAGAILTLETREDESAITSPVRIAVAIAIAVGLRLAFGTGGPAMAALACAAFVVSITSTTRRRTAHALGAIAIAMAPVFA